MASIDARLAGIEEALKGLKASYDAAEEKREVDHDTLVRLTTKFDSLKKKVETICDDKKESEEATRSRAWQGMFLLIGAIFGIAGAVIKDILMG